MCRAALCYGFFDSVVIALGQRCLKSAAAAPPWTGRQHFGVAPSDMRTSRRTRSYPQYPSGVVSASTEGYATAPRAVPRKPARTIVSICSEKSAGHCFARACERLDDSTKGSRW
jgi:hypothetical protein